MLFTPKYPSKITDENDKLRDIYYTHLQTSLSEINRRKNIDMYEG